MLIGQITAAGLAWKASAIIDLHGEMCIGELGHRCRE